MAPNLQQEHEELREVLHIPVKTAQAILFLLVRVVGGALGYAGLQGMDLLVFAHPRFRLLTR